MRTTRLWQLTVLMAALSAPIASQDQGAQGTITGTVRYQTGEPVVDVLIAVTAAPGSANQWNAGMRVDNEGRYRVSLPPGRYYVKAGFCSGQQLGHPCPHSGAGHLYHPGTVSTSGATIIEVKAGAVRERVDFTLTHDTASVLRAAADTLDSERAGLWRMRSAAPAPTTRWRSLSDMHGFFVATFIATPGMGSGRMGPMMLSLDPQQRLELPDEGRNAGSQASPTVHWRVKELELIGIARHPQPVVFTTIAHGPGEGVRAVNPFESQALTTLKTGRDIVSRRTNAGDMELIGGIRAASACVQCHQPYRDGDLLGAFRYVMERTTAASAAVPSAAGQR